MIALGAAHHSTILGCSLGWRIFQELEQDLKQTPQSLQGSRADGFHYRYPDLRNLHKWFKITFMYICINVYMYIGTHIVLSLLFQ